MTYKADYWDISHLYINIRFKQFSASVVYLVRGNFPQITGWKNLPFFPGINKICGMWLIYTENKEELTIKAIFIYHKAILRYNKFLQFLMCHPHPWQHLWQEYIELFCHNIDKNN